MHSTKRGISLTHSTSGVFPAKILLICATILPPNLLEPLAKSINKSSVFSFTIIWGVTAKLMSSMGAKAEMIKDNGEVTDSRLSPSFQSVAIDKESLPTGIVIFHSGQRPIPMASTAS